MGRLEILGPDGDLVLEWDPDDAASTERARGEFDRLRTSGYLLFTVRSPVTDFPPSAGALTVELAAAPAVVPATTPKKRGLLGITRKDNAEQTRDFEPKADRIVAAPPMRGG